MVTRIVCAFAFDQFQHLWGKAFASLTLYFVPFLPISDSLRYLPQVHSTIAQHDIMHFSILSLVSGVVMFACGIFEGLATTFIFSCPLFNSIEGPKYLCIRFRQFMMSFQNEEFNDSRYSNFYILTKNTPKHLLRKFV